MRLFQFWDMFVVRLLVDRLRPAPSTIDGMRALGGKVLTVKRKLFISPWRWMTNPLLRRRFGQSDSNLGSSHGSCLSTPVRLRNWTKQTDLANAFLNTAATLRRGVDRISEVTFFFPFSSSVVRFYRPDVGSLNVSYLASFTCGLNGWCDRGGLQRSPLKC